MVTDRFEQDLRRLQPGVDPARKLVGRGDYINIWQSSLITGSLL